MLADLRTDRIPNGFTILGIIVGLVWRLWDQGELLSAVVTMLLAFLLMYPLFKIGALGAGDVKVLMMVGSFLEMRALLRALAAAFVVGAVFSIVKLLREHNGRERLCYFLSYVSEVARARRWKIYGEYMVEDYQLYRKNKIHFTIPILLGVVLQIGGMI